MERILVTIKNETGLHSRPADLFVRTAKLYESKITVRAKEKEADAKNILKVILLNITQNSEIEIEAEGPDQKDALTGLKQLVESNFEQVNEKVTL